eukprot:401619_1
MITMLLVFVDVIYQVLGTVNCRSSVGYNQTSITRITETGQLYASYASLYSNGTLISYDQDNKYSGNGTYKIESGVNNSNECYITINWKCCNTLTNQTECVTLSPSDDGTGSVGCIVYNEECIKKCTPNNIGVAWFGRFILNKLVV